MKAPMPPRGCSEPARWRGSSRPRSSTTSSSRTSTASCSATSPSSRPLGYGFPDDPRSWTAQYELLVGPDLLAAPVAGTGTTPSVYLPAGSWVDLYTGTTVKGGGASFTRPTPLSQLPLYARAGAVIPFDLRTKDRLLVGRRRAHAPGPRGVPGHQRRDDRPRGQPRDVQLFVPARVRPAPGDAGGEASCLGLERRPAPGRRDPPARTGDPGEDRGLELVEFTRMRHASRAAGDALVALPAEKHPPVEDVRSGRPYLLRRDPFEVLVRRFVSIATLVVIDLAGLTIGLYAAIALRALVRTRSRSSGTSSGTRRRLAAVPRAAPAARVLAQPPLRPAGAAGGGRPDRASVRARRGGSRSPSRSARSALHDLRPVRRRATVTVSS